jgi:hypothetical protein
MKYFGFYDASVFGLLVEFPEFIRGFDCLLTCSDSSSETIRLKPVIAQPEKRIELGSKLGLSGDDLLNHLRIFDGFDSFIVLKKGALQQLSIVEDIGCFTSERLQFFSAIPPDLRIILDKYSAVRFCSDGVGLNVALEDEILFRKIESKFTRLASVR